MSEQVRNSEGEPLRLVSYTDSQLSHEDFNSLGQFYCNRFRRLGELDDLEKAVGYLSSAATMLPDNHPDYTRQLTNLALVLMDRFERLSRIEDLEKAIKYLSFLVGAISNDNPGLTPRLADLGMCYSLRFQHLGQLEDLAKSIEHSSRAVESTPIDHPDLSRQLANLASSYGYQFRCLGKLEYLDKAIDCFSRAVELIPSNHPFLLSQLTDLGICHTLRFERLGKLEDLAKAIDHSSRAVELTPNDHPDLTRRLASLGMSYDHRFRRLGELKDIDKAVGCFVRAVELLPDDHPNVSSWLANIGISYTDRFKHLGEIEDLEKAVEYCSRAVTLTSNDSPLLSGQLFALGLSYGARSQHLNDVGDIEKAIDYFARAVTSTPTGHPELPRRHSTLGMAYGDRYQYMGEIEDLEKSLQHESHAIELMPSSHPDLSRQLANVAVSYARRFDRLGTLEDLQNATDCGSRALVLTPDGHPDLPFRQFNQAVSHFRWYEKSESPLHLERSLVLFRKASQSLNGAPRDRFRYALKWAELASQHGTLDCIEAYQITISLLRQFIWHGATANQQYRDLLIAKSLPAKATTAAILSSNYPLALEWLEHTRCVVVNQILMLHSPLDQLHSLHPDVATHLQTVTNDLQRVNSETPAFLALSSKLTLPENDAQQRRRLAEEYHDVLAQTRQLPGFENFLQPMTAKSLICAARSGPIVVINCHPDRCDTLLIRPEQEGISHLPLLNFTEEKAQQARSEIEMYLRQNWLRERGVKILEAPGFGGRIGNVLAVLWTNIVKPILDFLGYINGKPGDSLPHLTWCLTGALSFLPLHAAGDYNEPQSRTFDYVVSSYTPNLTALLACTPRALSQDCRVLAIGQAATPGHNRLPGVTKELACVKNRLQNKATYTQLMDGQATTTAVLDAMNQNDWVHLACHAHQNIENPNQSGFYLHDGILELVTIHQQSFKNKGLAYLSACQTATGDEKLPNEAIYLASGMLMAGYPTIIATMWSIVDEDAPFVADKVYTQLVKDGTIGKGEAGKALHHAVAALREKVGEKNFGRWIPYIHIGS